MVIVQSGSLRVSARLPKVALVTDKNDLTLPLAKELIKNNCTVDVISKNYAYWRSRNKENEETLLGFIKGKDYSFEKKYSYVICLNLRKEKNEIGRKRRIKIAFRLAREHSAKALFIFPFTQSKETKNKIEEFVNKKLRKESFAWGVIYTGEILDEGMDTEEGERLSRIIKETIKGKKVVLPKTKQLLYPVVAKKVVKEIVRSLFSFGVVGKETVIISSSISSLDFINILKSKNYEIQISYKNIDWGGYKIVELNKRFILNKILKKKHFLFFQS